MHTCAFYFVNIIILFIFTELTYIIEVNVKVKVNVSNIIYISSIEMVFEKLRTTNIIKVIDQLKIFTRRCVYEDPAG